MKPYRVSEVNKYINQTLSTDFLLSDISIEGEISNYIHHNSGHMYFSLKDDNSRIKCVMFKSDNKDIDINMKNGMKIVARGNIAVYERDGVYQFYIKEIEESGLGDLYKEFEKLKRKLDSEGLFDDVYKKEIPKAPRNIGVVTSVTGAAIKDIIDVLKRRFPAVNIIIYPSLVQGKKAPEEIIKGLKYFDNREDIDLIIFGRGGGASEELFCFNDEKLARTIFDLRTPNISAIGHEIDFTISDFVSDLRAPTPSAAAELAVPDINAYIKRLDEIWTDILNVMDGKIINYHHKHNIIDRELEILSPLNKLRNKKQDLDNILDKFIGLYNNKFINEKSNLNDLKNRLSLLNPLLGLDKGYGILTDGSENLISSIDDLKLGDELNISLLDGRLVTIIKDIKKVDIDGYR